MNRKNKIFKAVLITFSALFTLSSFTSCSIGNEPKDSVAAPETTEKSVTHPGQYFKDKKNFFSLGGKRFDLSLDYESFKEVFGDEMTVWWSKEMEDEVKKEGEDIGLLPSFYDDIFATIVQNGVYSADVHFVYNDKTDKFEVQLFETIYDFGDKENFDIAKDVAYTENGEMKRKDFPYETDKIDFSVDGFSAGKANKEQIAERIGECRTYDSKEDYIVQGYYFEDYSLIMRYNGEGILNGVFIFKPFNHFQF